MALYVRVYNTFWSHRKTARLKSRIGDAAYWVPIRLWNYAADQQPDGNFSDYTADEIASAIFYIGDACAMLQALLQAGFMDENPLRIHDWQDHNGYHSTFAARAKTASAARWGRDKEKEKDIDKETSIASSIASSNATSIDVALVSGAVKFPSMTELAGEIYDCYPKKKKRPKAIAALLVSLKKCDSVFLRERTLLYAKMVKEKGGSTQFVPAPDIWFRNEQYNDDPSTWTCGDGNATQNTPKPNPRNLGFTKTDSELGAEYAAALRGCKRDA